MYGSQIWICLFMFLPITLKQLNILTAIDTYTCICGLEHQTAERENPGLIPGSVKDFYVCYFVLLLLCLLVIVQNALFVTLVFKLNS